MLATEFYPVCTVMNFLSSFKNNKAVVMAGVMLAMLLAALDQTIVSTSVSKIVSEFGDLAHLSWVFTSYMLASTITVPLYGKLSDIYGRRWFFIIGIVIFLVASALCGMSQDMFQLILFRGLQGVGGGAIMVNAFASIGDIFPPAERGKWQGLIGGVFGLSSVIGPLLGGWLTDAINWRWIFYINIPLGIVAALVIAFTFPKKPAPETKPIIDYLGALLLAATLVPFLLALVWGGHEYAWNSVEIISMLLGSVVALGLFIVTEYFAKNPILPLSLFKSRAFVVSVLCAFLSAMGMFGAILYIPLFAQGVVGFSATSSGLVLTPMMLGLVVCSALSGQAISRTGKYKAIAVSGMAVAILGMFLFSQMTPQTSPAALILNMVVMGIGLGLTMPVFNLIVQNAFEHDKLGVVTAATQLFRSVGGTVGTAILGGILNNELAKNVGVLTSHPFVQMFHDTPAAQQFATINGNMVQAFLSPEGQQGLHTLVQSLPIQMQAQLTFYLDSFFLTVKTVFSSSISTVFMVGALLMAIAFVISWFLPVLELRKSNRPALEEMGVDLDHEFGQADPKDEPLNVVSEGKSR